MTSLDRPWDDLHQRSYFLPELRIIETGEFTLTMTGDRACPIYPLAMHTVYAEGNMETIARTIPIDIYKSLASWRISSSEQIAPPRIFESTQIYLKNFAACFLGLTRK
jgi:hypothetical protein